VTFPMQSAASRHSPQPNHHLPPALPLSALSPAPIPKNRSSRRPSALRSLAIIVLAPCLDHPRGLGERAEPVLVQAFVPEPADEAFDECVLDLAAPAS
jgi:hypothetical protein